MNKLPPNVATAGDLVTSAGTDLLRSLHFAATVMNPTWLIAEDEVQVNDMPADSFDKVYRGLWKGSQVAVLKPRTEKDGDDAVFLRDVEIWYNLRHPHILQLFGACQKFFVCEDVDNGSLDQYLPSHRHEVWGKLYEVALGLQYLHSHCVVYGPFQCRDILMGKDGRVKLSGLGMGTLEAISSLCGEKCWTARPGKVGWTAPELLCGERATFASDIYSLGMIILEAATGKCPWLSCGQVIPDGAIKFQVLKKKAFPTRPASCPENIYELVQQMCRFDASERGGLKEVIDGMSELSAKAKVYKPMCSPDELHDFDELYGDWQDSGLS
ncbi:hypothetical protein ON010_g17671 [Phytophthora cinnamomi]|nr:hypothetical protein ON010_g17671 [Phytophthora cinnamomi]